MITLLKNYYFSLEREHPDKMKIFRYLISGGMATLTNILFLFIFTDLFGIYYVVSAVMSYLVSFIVSFLMQKYWTFQDKTNHRLITQIVIYFLINITNIGFNALSIFIFVNYFGIYYLFAQIIISIIIAIINFVIYRFIFRNNI